MRFLALATDYDGTLATHGSVDETTRVALVRLKESGRRLILVTGRELDELLAVFPHTELFDRVVAENGALLYRPAEREEKVLGERPTEAFVEALRARGVGPLSVGRVIVATWEPHQAVVLEVIKELGLELQVIFNKGAVMVLPSGVNKATGLAAALEELGLSPHNVVGVGDAENDHAFLAFCECAVAVANALPTLKERADYVTSGDHGAGVVELIDKLIRDDMAEVSAKLARHAILLGTRDDGTEVTIEPYGINVLVAGTSGSGKSTITTGLLERLSEKGYQFAIIDPEGDYSTLPGAVVLGDPHRAPTVEEVLELLGSPRLNAVVNLLGIALEHRPAFFMELLPRLQELRARTGRPHWVIVDEAHHLLPSSWIPANLTVPQQLQGMLLITVHPESVAPAILSSVNLVLAVGESPEKTIRDFCKVISEEPPEPVSVVLKSGEVLAWRRGEDRPVHVRTTPPRTERIRHSRKYAEGELGPDRSFRFRGPDGKLNLRAQNLGLFLQMADGVDDATWLYHLRRGDYSRWFREEIKDDGLADEARQVEQREDASPQESRAAIRAAIERRYTLPTDKPSGDHSNPDSSPV
jgi:HAD superfamily hydrolase (TIGR01484 family)